MGASTKKYVSAGTVWKLLAALLLGLTSQSVRQMSDFWVRAWAADTYNFYKSETEIGSTGSHMYAWVYGAITFAFFAIQLLRTGMFFYWGACASNAMHRLKLHRVLNAPLGFFLAKPVGELLSTFSSDQDKADESLPDILHLAGARPSLTAGLVIPTFVTPTLRTLRADCTSSRP